MYQVEQNPGVPPEQIQLFIQRRLLGDRKMTEFTEGLIAGVKQHRPQIDKLISEVAENWRLDRMAAIDRNILRLGAYEMLHHPEVPPKVAINEALELAKRFSTAQSSRFVNGILDRVLQSQTSEAASPESKKVPGIAEFAEPAGSADPETSSHPPSIRPPLESSARDDAEHG